MGLKSGREAFDEGKLLSLLGFDPLPLGCSAPSLVAIPTELSTPLLMLATWLSRFVVSSSFSATSSCKKPLEN